MPLFNEEEREELKSLIRELVADGASPGDAQATAAAQVAGSNGGQPDAVDIAQAKTIAEMKATIDQVLEHLEKTPAIKSVGYVSDDGGAADKDVKSLGDFLLSIKRGDHKRLTDVYGSRKVAWADFGGSTKDIQSQDGPGGGYLAPEQYVDRFMEVAAPLQVVRPRASVIPVQTDHGRMPSLDQSTAPTAGQGDSAFAGGVVANWTAPGGTLTETQPTFEQVEFVIRKLAGYTEVENEILADSAIGIEALLVRLFGRAVAAMEDYAFLRGTGAAEPLGILNAAAAVAISPATNDAFAYADALSMKARFKSTGGRPVWLIHPGVWPDIGIFEVGTGGAVWMANVNSQELTSLPLLGYSILESEHLPQDDNSGNVILADLSAYVIFDRSQMAIAFSEHASFTSDKGTWRFTKRLDGQPWVSGTITLADPQGSYTVSPFVYHND